MSENQQDLTVQGQQFSTSQDASVSFVSYRYVPGSDPGDMDVEDVWSDTKVPLLEPKPGAMFVGTITGYPNDTDGRIVHSLQVEEKSSLQLVAIRMGEMPSPYFGYRDGQRMKIEAREVSDLPDEKSYEWTAEPIEYAEYLSVLRQVETKQELEID